MQPLTRYDAWHTPRMALLALLVLAVVVADPPAHAWASSLHILAPKAKAFATDGRQYAVWQIHEGAPIVVLDTRVGRRHAITTPARCDVASQTHVAEPGLAAAAGRFMVSCAQGFGLLDVRTGLVAMLPRGTEWRAVGTRYVEGRGDGSRCRSCVALYEIASAAISDRPEGEVDDLDRAGAPPVCPALRHGALIERQESSSTKFAYDDGVLAHAGAHLGNVRIDRCQGRPTTIGGYGEPLNYDLRGGVLSWDTGHSATLYYKDVGEFSHGAVSVYELSNRKRRSWTLPNVPLQGGEFSRGVFGYSSHTRTMVFWIAARVLNGPLVESSSIYAVPVK